MDVPRGRHEAHRGAGRAVPRRRPRRPRARPVRPARPLLGGLAPRCPATARRGSRLPGLARAHRRLQGQRRRFESVDHSVRRGHDAPRAADRWIRRRPHPRARRATDRVGRHRLDSSAAGGHVPLVLEQAPSQRARQRDGGEADAQPPARTDRRLRGGSLDRPSLVRRPLPDHPQRRPRRLVPRRGRRRPAARRPVADRVRGPGGRAQGAAAAPARIRGAARPHSDGADRDRPHSGRARPADARSPWRADARQGRRGREAPRARGVRCPVRSLDRRRELRNGLDRGVRGRNAGRRI